MHIKRFRGRTIEGALKGVKETFGRDAVILSTRKNDGIVEVLAAIDFDIEELERRFNDDTINAGLDGIRREFDELKCLFSSLVRDKALMELAGIGRGALKLYYEMLSKGIDEELSQSLVRTVASTVRDGDDLRDTCYRIIKEKTSICNPLSSGDRPRLLALVGPTGVGKTLTIAKLTGILTQRFKAKVGLISVDNARPGANEALKLCGRRFGVPIWVPKTKEDFNRVLWGYKDKDVVLIDTPGKNPKDRRAISQLGGMLNGGLPIKTGLVLSVTSRDESLVDACKGFNTLPVNCLVFTKIDEAPNCGSILNTSTFIKKPIAYLCNGQKIPQDIGTASHELVSNLVFGRG